MRDEKNEQVVEGHLDLETYDWEHAFQEGNQAINHAKPFDSWGRLPWRIERGMVIEGYFYNEGENDADPWLLVGKALAPPLCTKMQRVPGTPEGYRDDRGFWNPPKMEQVEYPDFEHPQEFYFSLSAWCDYTGWDCQAGGRLQVGDTLRDVLVYGLSDSERDLLGISLTDIDNLPPLVKLR